MRRWREQPADRTHAGSATPQPDEAARAAELAQAIERATAALPPRTREAYLLRRQLVGLASIDLGSGRISQLNEEAKVYRYPGNFPVVMPDGRGVIYAAESAQIPPNLWLASAAGQSSPRQVTALGDSQTESRATSARVLDWRSLDGDTLHGALIHPVPYTSGVTFPLIVKVYGGEDLSNDLNRYGFASSQLENLQIFTSRGYAVLLADSRLNVGTPMLDLLKSVVPGVDRAIDSGIADPARVGLIGHSYGGYATLALIAQSHRFKAAVMRAGFGDLVSAYGQLGEDETNFFLSWAERGQGRMEGTPWEVRDRYIENSPIHYLDRVETPLLIVHGAEDASFLADQVFTGLRRLGKRVEYARYQGEGHFESQWSRANQLDYLNRVLAWFDRYLKPGEHIALALLPPDRGSRLLNYLTDGDLRAGLVTCRSRRSLLSVGVRPRSSVFSNRARVTDTEGTDPMDSVTTRPRPTLPVVIIAITETLRM